MPAHADIADPASGLITPPIATAAGARRVLGLEELAARLPQLQPPAAYRLSLDSGVGYKNVRRAFEDPMAIRIGTWQRLLRSLRIELWAVCAQAGRVDRGAIAAGAGPLRTCRLARGWSRRELALRAGVSIDAVAAIESGAGLAGSLARVCQALDLRLVAALPPHCPSLEVLWAERAPGCLTAPAHYAPARPGRHDAVAPASAASPPRPQTAPAPMAAGASEPRGASARIRVEPGSGAPAPAQISASMASAAEIDCSRARLIASGSTGQAAQAAS